MSKHFNDEHKKSSQGSALHLDITPQPKAERAREPVTRSRGLVRGQFPSTKMKHMIAWESQLEEKACYYFEFSPAVVSFREQPLTLSFPTQKGLIKYTPDFELTLNNGEICYVEVKPLSKLRLPQVMERLQSAHQFLAEKGYNFIVLTDEELNFPVRIRNFKILRPYQRFQISSRIIQQAKAWLAYASDPTLEALSHFLVSQTTTFALLSQSHIRFDLNKRLSNSSLLFQGSTGDSYETCLFAYRTGPDFK